MVGILQKDEEEAQGQEGATQAPTFGSPAPAPQSGAPNAISGSAPKGSGMFTNLDKFLEANKEQTGTMAKNVAGNVQTQGEGLIKDVEGKTSTAIGGMAKAPTAVNIASTSTADLGGSNIPDALNITEEEQASWKPNVDFSPESRNIEQLGTTITNTATGAGLQSLVGRAYEGQNVTGTAGQRGFDTMLLQRDPNSQSEMQKLRTWGTGTLANAVGVNKQKIADEAKARQDAAVAAQTGAREQVTSAAGELTSKGARAATSRQSSIDQQLSALEAEIGLATLTPEERASLVTGSTEATANLASEDLARLNALKGLMGESAVQAQAGLGINEAAARKLLEGKRAEIVSRDAAQREAKQAQWNANITTSPAYDAHPEWFSSGPSLTGGMVYFANPAYQKQIDEYNAAALAGPTGASGYYVSGAFSGI